ncbi:hypothetical protein ACWCQM_09005 [Streptomyces sp. NPDC002125]
MARETVGEAGARGTHRAAALCAAPIITAWPVSALSSATGVRSAEAAKPPGIPVVRTLPWRPGCAELA